MALMRTLKSTVGRLTRRSAYALSEEVWADFDAIRSVHVLHIPIRQGLKVPVSLFARLKASLTRSQTRVRSGVLNPATGKFSTPDDRAKHAERGYFLVA